MSHSKKTNAKLVRSMSRSLLTSNALAKASGVDRATITRLRAGRQSPRQTTAWAIANALKVTPQELGWTVS